MRLALHFNLMLAAACAASLWACGDDLGECNPEAAKELVYGRNGLVATKGQALTHDSCGNGVFCHSSAANGSARHGAPKGLDFDMLPRASGLSDLLHLREDVWDSVRSEQMPPRKSGAVTGNGDWSLDVQRNPGAPKLPTLSSKEGKAALRNWLACGAPTVADTHVPGWAQMQPDPFDGQTTPSWKTIYDVVMKPSCALAGCHDATSKAGGLAMRDMCSTRTALLAAGACGQPEVRPAMPDASLLVNKLEDSDPSCGDTMPPGTPLPQSQHKAIRDWITAGAKAEECP